MRWSLRIKGIAYVAIGSLLLVASAVPASVEQAKKEKVAEGEYAMEGEAGGGEVMKYRESWTLWKVEEKSYEVKAKWDFQLGDLAFPVELSIRLSSDLRPVTFRMTGAIPGMSSRRAMSCEAHPNEFVCNAGTKQAKVAMKSPYDVHWPFSWFLSSVVRRAVRNTGQPTSVNLIFIDDGDPVEFGTFEGRVVYLGRERVTGAGKTFEAEKFELQPGPFPRMLVWTSPEGIMLASQGSEEKPEERMELVRYEKYADFGPIKQ